MSEVNAYLDQHRDRFEEELCQLLRIPSISTDGQYAPDVRRAADWMADHFRAMGLTTELIETARHPIVLAESPVVEGAPTVLVYGHYDVQPPDPLDEWISPPFEPTVRDGNVYARGATDDKGQMFTHIKSAQAWLDTLGRLPVQLKFLIEGEEESGSDSLYAFLEQSADRLDCDIVVISDSSQFAPNQPAITCGLRGISYFELRLRGPRQDLHSGSFGGIVKNPALALAEMLAAMIDSEGRVQVPGFYDEVRELSATERQQLAELPCDDQQFARQLGVESLFGEQGYSLLERRWTRPTYDVHGIWGGYSGEGGKTVIPCRAAAKFSFRLVPDQDPRRIAEATRTFLENRRPAGIEMELVDMGGAPSAVVSSDSPFVAAAAAAIESGFGRPPVYIREGGSIPVVSAFRDKLGADTLLLGWGLDDDNTHSPNEKFCLADFHRGIRASAQLWQELGKVRASSS